MSQMSRLGSAHPALAKSLQGASQAVRIAVLQKACADAIEYSSLSSADSETALNHIASGTSGDQVLMDRLQALADKLDDEYFDLSESSDPERKDLAIKAFSQARAANALSIAVEAGCRDLDEAVYEAIMAAPDALSAIDPLLKIIAEKMP